MPTPDFITEERIQDKIAEVDAFRAQIGNTDPCTRETAIKCLEHEDAAANILKKAREKQERYKSKYGRYRSYSVMGQGR